MSNFLSLFFVHLILSHLAWIHETACIDDFAGVIYLHLVNISVTLQREVLKFTLSVCDGLLSEFTAGPTKLQDRLTKI